MLGLKHGINTIVDHDPEWSRAFMEERARIHAAIGTVARGIEHYGSTAVDGLKAKPILDILVGVAPGSVQMLHVFAAGANTEAPPAPPSQGAALPNFKDLLLRSLGK